MRDAHICVCNTHKVKLNGLTLTLTLETMTERTANLLGALGLALADRIEAAATQVLKQGGETSAALVVIGYGLGPSNDQLRRVLRLSHSGTVRLVDRLVAEGLVERRQAADGRAVALHATKRGRALREKILKERLQCVETLLTPLTAAEEAALATLVHKMLRGMNPSDMGRRTLCRLCDNRVCTNCPIPADF